MSSSLPGGVKRGPGPSPGASIVQFTNPMTFTYRPEVLALLAAHGFRPLPATRPAFVLACLNDLYRYELRRLRDRLRRREFRQDAYYERVVDLRRQYPLVSVHPKLWTVPGTPAEPDDVALC